MRRALSAIFLLALAIGPCSGCLFVRHSTRVVRKDEPVRHVEFESPQAQNLFEGGVTQLKPHQDTANPQVVAVPLLFWYSRTDVLGDGAFYNDQILGCDTDGDGLITLAEAEAFRARAGAEAQAAKSAGSKREGPRLARSPRSVGPDGEELIETPLR